MRRVIVIGCSGAGKTHFSRALARRLGVPHVERDHLGPLGPGAFREAAAHAVAADRWVFDGAPYYAEAHIYPLADLVIWLDYRRALVLRRAIRRAIGRTFGTPEEGAGGWGRLGAAGAMGLAGRAVVRLVGLHRAAATIRPVTPPPLPRGGRLRAPHQPRRGDGVARGARIVAKAELRHGTARAEATGRSALSCTGAVFSRRPAETP